MTRPWRVCLEDKVALVTGGSMGIGADVSRAVVAEGGRVVMVARRAEAGQALVAELGPDRTTFVAGDVSEPGTATAAVETAVEQFGRIDVLINNAGIDHTSSILDTPIAEAQRVMNVNFMGAFWMLQACARAMRLTGGGSIVNVASRTALAGVPTMAMYSASKGAMLSLTRSAAIELAADGVRVNAVAPGLTRTALVEAWLSKQADRAEFEATVAATIPQRRFAEPMEVVSAILFLASEAASYITGATLSVDGGFTAA